MSRLVNCRINNIIAPLSFGVYIRLYYEAVCTIEDRDLVCLFIWSTPAPGTKHTVLSE